MDSIVIAFLFRRVCVGSFVPQCLPQHSHGYDGTDAVRSYLSIDYSKTEIGGEPLICRRR